MALLVYTFFKALVIKQHPRVDRVFFFFKIRLRKPVYLQVERVIVDVLGYIQEKYVWHSSRFTVDCKTQRPTWAQ